MKAAADLVRKSPSSCSQGHVRSCGKFTMGLAHSLNNALTQRIKIVDMNVFKLMF